MGSELNLHDYMESPGLETIKEAVQSGSSAHGSGTSSESTQHGSTETMGIATGMLIFSMILYMSFGTKLAHSSKYIGEGMSAVFTGLALGGFLMAIGRVLLTQDTVEQLLTFDHSSFFTFYLPPIILFAGLSVRKKAFFRNLPTIAAMGIVGTYIGFAFIAGLLAAFAKVIPGITLADCLALGAIFATTDSVAVLQVLEQDRAPLLFSLVFGEGVINDATTVALLRTVQGLGATPSMNLRTVTIIFGKFLYLFIISMVMGLACGFASSLLLKKFPATGTPQAVGLVGTTAYMAYLISEHLGLSGIVTLFICAVTMSHYAMHNLTKTQRAACMSAFETLSYFSEGSIFVYVGLDALDPAKWKYTHVGRAIGLSFIVIVLLLMSRALFCFPVLFGHNYLATEKVNYREMIIAWWAGAMRGAVSVALVYYYYDNEEDAVPNSDHATLVSMTLVVVLISTLCFGAVTKPLLDFMLGADDHAGHGSSENGLEMVSAAKDGGDNDGHAALRAKAVHAVIDMPGPEEDEGYETDATAFTDGGYTSAEDEHAHLTGSARRTKRTRAQPDADVEDGVIPTGEVSPNQRANLERLASLLKGTAPPVLIASPDGSPKGDAGRSSPWQAFGGGGPGMGGGLQVGAGPFAAAVRGGADGREPPVMTPRRQHVTFAELPPGKSRAVDDDVASTMSAPAAPPAPMARAGSLDVMKSRFRIPLRLGRTSEAGQGLAAGPRQRPESRQLVEWWADFDERYMKPMFNRPDDAWTPTSPEAAEGKHAPHSKSASTHHPPSGAQHSHVAGRPAIPMQNSGRSKSGPLQRTRTSSFPPKGIKAEASRPPSRTSSTPTFLKNEDLEALDVFGPADSNQEP